MKKLTKGDKTKQHLYECALELFRTRGYDQVSVAEIVRSAGTAKGTFYIYFQTKADVINELLHQYDDYYHTIYDALSPDLSVEERLDTIVTESCRFTRDTIGRDLIRVLYENHLAVGTGSGTMAMDRALYQLIGLLISEGQQTGRFDSSQETETLTTLLIRCIRASYFEWCLQGDSFDLVQETLRMTRMFRRSFCCPVPQSPCDP